MTKLGLDCPRLGMAIHTEQYEDINEQRGFVEDLDARWKAEQERAAFRLTPADAWVTISVDLPAPQPIAWQYGTNPRLRQQWMSWVIRIDQETTDGRPGVGTINHCVHGGDVTVEEVIDYRPYETMTIRSTTPAGPLTMTFNYETAGDGTMLTVLCAMDGSVKSKLMWPVARRMIQDRFGEGLTNLKRLLSERRGAGDPERDALSEAAAP